MNAYSVAVTNALYKPVRQATPIKPKAMVTAKNEDTNFMRSSGACRQF